ncbi:MAG: ATP-binding protein [Flavobacteriaceae bacterium]|nr:ATP-binding protein [Flavobacteriaceae bacterium]
MKLISEEKNTIRAAYLQLKNILKWRLDNPEADYNSTQNNYHSALFSSTPTGNYILKNELDSREITVLLLALSPYLYPTLLREVSLENKSNILCDFSEIRANQINTDPTGETVQYVLGGTSIEQCLQTLFYFRDEHFFTKKHVLYLDITPKGVPFTRGKLQVYQDAFQEIVFGATCTPKLSEEFPAQEINTGLAWGDLILPNNTLLSIQDMHRWLQHNDTLLGELNMGKKFKPGYRVLFHGPPGTGKTLAASLLGKHTNKPVFRVDLSVLVSKYIGETEKHLANLFNKAEDKNWILFFDEADSIFGKRTSVKDSHDKYANQGVSYLLQKIESFPGMVILASNYKENIDNAFMRRFQSIIKFELPRAAERIKIWERNLPKQLQLADGVDLQTIAHKYILNGSNIMNCIHDVSLQALANTDRVITQEMLLQSIKKEYEKEDKIF